MSRTRRKRMAPQPTAQAVIADRERRGLLSATPERLAKSGAPLDIRPGPEDHNPVEVQRVEDWPLKLLFEKGALGPKDKGGDGERRYAAGRRYYEHWFHSGLGAGPSAVDLNAVGGSFGSRDFLPASERAAVHRQELRRAQAALGDNRAATLTAFVVLNEMDLTKAAKAVFRGRHDRASLSALGQEFLKEGLDRLRALWKM